MKASPEEAPKAMKATPKAAPKATNAMTAPPKAAPKAMKAMKAMKATKTLAPMKAMKAMKTKKGKGKDKDKGKGKDNQGMRMPEVCPTLSDAEIRQGRILFAMADIGGKGKGNKGKDKGKGKDKNMEDVQLEEDAQDVLDVPRTSYDNNSHPDIPETCQCSTADIEQMLRDKEMYSGRWTNDSCHWCQKKLDLRTLSFHALSSASSANPQARSCHQCPLTPQEEAATNAILQQATGLTGPWPVACYHWLGQATAAAKAQRKRDNEEAMVPENAAIATKEMKATKKATKEMKAMKAATRKTPNKAMKTMMQATAKKKTPKKAMKTMKEMKTTKAATRKIHKAMKTMKTMKTADEPSMYIHIVPHNLSMSSQHMGGIERVKATDTITHLISKIYRNQQLKQSITGYTSLPVDFGFVLSFKGMKLRTGRVGEFPCFEDRILDYGIRDGDVIRMLWSLQGEPDLDSVFNEFQSKY